MYIQLLYNNVMEFHTSSMISYKEVEVKSIIIFIF